MAALILIAIPVVFALILTLNSFKLMKKVQEYVKNPANVPFSAPATLQKKVLGFLIFFAVLGLQFFGPIYSMLEAAMEETEGFISEIIPVLWILTIFFSIGAFVLGIVSLTKFSQAKRVNNQLIFKNNMMNNQGNGNNMGGFQAPFVQRKPASQINMRQQNLNGFQGPWANSSNDVPEGYEAPPDLNGYYGHNYQNPVQRTAVGGSVNQNPVQRTANVNYPQNNVQNVKSVQGVQKSNNSGNAQAAELISCLKSIQEQKSYNFGNAQGLNNSNTIGTVTSAIGGAAVGGVIAPQNSPQPVPKFDSDILKKDLKAVESEMPKMPDLPKMPELTNSSFPERIDPFQNKNEKRCPHCGVVNPDKNSFCEFCGKDL